MKKILAALMCLTLCLTVFAACSKKSEAVKAVEALIENLDGSDDALNAAYDAYIKLSAEEKDLVKNADALQEAKQKSDDLKNLGKDVSDAAETLRQQKLSGSVQYSETLTKAGELLEKYNALSDEEKAKVDAADAVAKLQEQLPAITETQTEAEKNAAEYVKAFRQVHPDETVRAVYCIGKRDAAGDFYYVFALTAGDEKDPTAYYATARSISLTAADYAANADRYFAAEPVSTHDAIKNGNITLDLAAVEALIQ